MFSKIKSTTAIKGVYFMRQSLKASQWRQPPLIPAGDRSEASMLSRAASAEEHEWIHLEFKPGRALIPRPGS